MPLVPHRHCIVCGKAIEADKYYCSDECEQKIEKERRRQRNFTLFMFLMLLLILLIFWLPILFQ